MCITYEMEELFEKFGYRDCVSDVNSSLLKEQVGAYLEFSSRE